MTGVRSTPRASGSGAGYGTGDADTGREASPAQAASPDEEEINATFAAKYVSILDRGRFVVLGAWVVVLLVSAVFGPRLLSNTTEVFYPPAETVSALENAAVASLFPGVVKTTDLVLYIESTRQESVLRPSVQAFAKAFNTSAYAGQTPGFVKSVEGYYTLAAMDLKEQGLKAFVSPNKQATIILVSVNALVVGKPAQDYANYLIQQINELKPKDGRELYTLLGAPAFLGPATASVEEDMALMDGIVLPIAITIMWFMLRTWRLMLLPLVTVAVSALASFAVMYAVSFRARVFTVVPSLMMSLVLAISIDYSLFLLVRYRVELEQGRSNRLAVVQMMRFAGKTIGISGLVLAICFFGLVVYPVETIRTMGYACGTVVLMVLTANETLIPVILLTLPSFFEKSANSSCYQAVARVAARVCCCCFGGAEADTEAAGAGTGLLDDSPSAKAVRRREASWWYIMGRKIVRCPWNVAVIAAVVAISIPFDLHAFDFTTSDEMVMDMPRGDATSTAFQSMIGNFGYGTIFPYHLVVKAPDSRLGHGPGSAETFSSPILDEALFVQLQDAFTSWKKTVPNADKVAIEGLMYAGGVATNASDVANCMTPGYILYPFPLCKLARMLYKQAVNADGTATDIILTPRFYVTSDEGRQWLDGMRSAVSAFSDKHGVALHLVGPGADSLDTISVVFNTFPKMIAITCSVVFLVMAVSFQSLLIPIRSVISISLTLMMVFGAANLTYEHSMLDWLHVAGLANMGTIVWLAPMTTFVIVVGISLDYDVFITVAIVEERDKGHESREAIARGLYNTGYIITAAGIIMGVAFSGLVMASINTLNQFGFYLVWAVLLDTFVVRSLLVPAVMGVLGDTNFYPGATGWTSCRRPVAKAHSGEGRKDVLSQLEGQ